MILYYYIFNMIELAPVIKKPGNTYSYRKYIEEKKEKQEKDEELKKKKELKEEMKKKLSPEEYNKWKSNEWYNEHKEEVKEKNKKKREVEEALNIEEFEELAEDYPPLKKEREKELELLNKYRPDYVSYENKFKLYWWCTPLASLWRFKQTQIKSPIKLIPTPWIEASMRERLKQQIKVYEYLKPYLWEIKPWDYFVRDSKKQRMFNKLQYNIVEWTKLHELWEEKKESKNVMCMILSAIHNDAWIESVPYYWMCWLCWDRLYTSMWQIFIVSPYNNWRYLNEDNFDQVHEDTRKFIKREDYRCAVCLSFHMYMVKTPREIIQNEEWEKEVISWDYYMVPFRYRGRVKSDPKTYKYETLYKKR